MTLSATAGQVLGARVRAQQLDRDAGTAADTAVLDTAVLDIGVQDTGPDGGLWALALRGVRPEPGELSTVWTIRGAPHLYRRADLPGVAAATAPFSEADAAKRVFDAAKALKAAGIPVLTGLDTVAAAMRSIVTGAMVKGEMSGRLREVLDEPYLRYCRPCDAIHAYEQTFRLSALRAGLELQPGTSPPVLQPVPGLHPVAEVPERLDVVRAYLRLLGPATPQHVAGYLDSPVKEVRARWPEDAVEVEVDGQRRWTLDADGLAGGPLDVTRLLGPFDLFLQGRDRELIAPDPAHRKALWPVLGRPGAVLAGGAVAGLWRPRKAGSSLTVAVELWASPTAALRKAVEEQAERLAAFRGVTLKAVEHP
jgi:hypothetical protein